jgi:excisionase family DNA binding protein
MNGEQLKELFTVRELAEYLKMNPKMLQRKARIGEIPAFKLGRQFRFDKAQIETWLSHKAVARPLQILVVDDDPVIGQLFTKILAPYQEFQVTTASSGKEAIAIFPSQRFDMVFLDLVMPGMDGVEVMKHLREMSREIPVAIITGYPDSNLLVKVGQYSPYLTIFKPFLPSQIIGAVKSIRASIAASVSSQAVD